MSYDAEEKSAASSRPAELYVFAVEGAGLEYRITDSDASRTYLGTAFPSGPIRRDAFSKSSEKSSVELNIYMPWWESTTDDIAINFMSAAATGRMSVKIYRQNLDSSPVQTILFWSGFVSNAVFQESGELMMQCKSVRGYFDKEGPRVKYAYTCNNQLYDNGCTLLEDAFTVVDRVVSSVGSDGVTITLNNLVTSRSPQYPDQWFKGGKLSVGNGLEFRMVASQVGNVLTVRYPFVTLTAGDLVDLSAGCDHTIQTCKRKFANNLNFWGAPYQPRFNPFSREMKDF